MRAGVIGIIALSLLACGVHADVYSTSFEAPTYSAGELSGQDGWFGTTTVSTVSADQASDGNWSLRQGSTSAVAQRSFASYNFGNQMEVSMKFIPSAFQGTTASYASAASIQFLLQDASGNAATSTAVMFYYWGNDSTKKILTKKYGVGNSYVALPSNGWNNDTWNTLSVKFDFAAHTYDITLNGVVHPGASGIALDPNAAKIGTMWLFRGAINGTARPYTYFDELQVASVPEPATVSLLAIGSLGCLSRKMR